MANLMLVEKPDSSSNPYKKASERIESEPHLRTFKDLTEYVKILSGVYASAIESIFFRATPISETEVYLVWKGRVSKLSTKGVDLVGNIPHTDLVD